MGPEDSILLNVVRSLLDTLEKWTTLNGWFKWVWRSCLKQCTSKQDAELPSCASDLYVILCLVIAVISLQTASSGIVWPSWAFFVVVMWPLLRLYDLLIFVLCWIFVHTGFIRAARRSLLIFVLNLLEIAILTTALRVWIGTSASSDRWGSVADAFFAMVSITAPTSSASGSEYLVEVTQFGLGTFLMLCAIGSLVGEIVHERNKGG